MKLEARAVLGPPQDLRMLVGGVVVDDQMRLLIRRDFRLDVPQELKPFHMGLPLGGLADDLPIPVRQRVEQGERPVAAAVARLAADMATPRGSPGQVRSSAWHGLSSSQHRIRAFCRAFR